MLAPPRTCIQTLLHSLRYFHTNVGSQLGQFFPSLNILTYPFVHRRSGVNSFRYPWSQSLQTTIHSIFVSLSSPCCTPQTLQATHSRSRLISTMTILGTRQVPGKKHHILPFLPLQLDDAPGIISHSGRRVWRNPWQKN